MELLYFYLLPLVSFVFLFKESIQQPLMISVWFSNYNSCRKPEKKNEKKNEIAPFFTACSFRWILYCMTNFKIHTHEKKGRKIVGHPVQYFMVHLFSFYCIFNLHYSLITKSDQINIFLFWCLSYFLSLLCWTFSNTSLTSLQIVMPNTIHQQLPILLMYTYKDLFWTLLLFFRFALSSLLKMKLSLLKIIPL